MWFANAEYGFGQIEKNGREVMEQPEEHCVPQSVANFQVGHPDDRVTRIDVSVLIQNVGELLDGNRVSFTGCAMD